MLVASKGGKGVKKFENILNVGFEVFHTESGNISERGLMNQKGGSLMSTFLGI